MHLGRRPLTLILQSLLLSSSFLFFISSVLAQTSRPPVWAGTFYPAKTQELQAQLTQLCEQAKNSSGSLPEHGSLRALILPHAGYIYSGLTAAHAARVLTKNQFDKVILIGPDHNVGFRGGAISAVAAYRTPLGIIPLHEDAGKLLEQRGLFRSSTLSDTKEHSLEVVLPFLQHLMDEFSLVPIVLGPSDIQEVSRAIRPLIDEKTLLVISSDLSHYLSYQDAISKDRHTTQGILNLDATVLTEKNAACGQYGLQLLIQLAREFNWHPTLLHSCNSGDTAGSKDNVVGYCSIAFFEKRSPTLSVTQGQTLLRLARQSIAKSLGQELKYSQELDLQKTLNKDVFSQNRSTFVTLTKEGHLRGCIGSIMPSRPLAEDVHDNAISAAHNDPRFPSLQKHELEDIAIEVSILTTPEPRLYEDGTDLLRKLRPGIDGVILRYGRHGSTYLPQVWEQLPDPEDFLSRLCIKAGLPSNAWRERKLEVQTYQVQHFNE